MDILSKGYKPDNFEPHNSSNVNEAIRAILNLFVIFFYKKISHTQKAQNTYKRIIIKKDSIFMCIETSKRKKIACLTFCAFHAFYVHKKHLRRGKPLVCVLCFFVLFILFMLFVCVKSFCKKKKEKKRNEV